MAFGALIIFVGSFLFVPVVQDGFSDGANVPARIERDLSAGQWLVLEKNTGTDLAITGVNITSDSGLSFPARPYQRSDNVLIGDVETMETADGTFVIAAVIDIPSDGTWTLDIASDRPTEILISPGLGQLNRLGTGVIFVLLGLMTLCVGLVVTISDTIKRSRPKKPGKTISPPITV